MPNTHIFKSCIVGVSQLSTFVESFCLLRIIGLLGIILVSNNVLAQSESIEPLPSTVPAATEQDERIVEVRIEGNETVEISKLPQLNTRAGQNMYGYGKVSWSFLPWSNVRHYAT
jgi:hypothetical protein